MNCYNSEGKLYLKRLEPGMRLMVWRMGPPALINGIVKEDTYQFLRKYETVAGEHRYIIRNLNKYEEHNLEEREVVDIFGLSLENPDKEDKEMAKLRINAVKPGMTLKAVNGIYDYDIYAGREYRVDTIEHDMWSEQYKIRLYYAPTGTHYYLKQKDFMYIFDLAEAYKEDDHLRVELSPIKDMSHSLRYVKNDILCTAEVIKTRFVMLPVPKFIQINGDYTTAVWKDGSHTVVKLAEYDDYDEDELYMILTFKKIFDNNNSAMKKYFKLFSDNVKDISS